MNLALMFKQYIKRRVLDGRLGCKFFYNCKSTGTSLLPNILLLLLWNAAY
jgi:hypothetical protein